MRAIPMLLAQLLSVTFLLPAAATAEKIIIHEIQEAQQQYHEREHAMQTPFLSATLKTDIFPVTTSIKSDQKTLLSNSLINFLQRIFDDQQVYDVEIVGVAIFEEQILTQEGGENRGRRWLVEQQKESRKMALNALQKNQFHFRRDDDGYGENDGDNEREEDDAEWDELENLVEKESGFTLRFATVVSAEHKQHQSLSHEDFQTMLIHICHKFESHLVAFVNDIGDEYFEDVKAVVVSGYEEQESNQRQHMTFEVHDTTTEAMEEMPVSKKMSTGSIVAIALSCLLVIPFAFASLKLYRREKRLKTNRWRSQEISSSANNSSIKSLRILCNTTRVDDDYSFDPLGTDNGYNGNAIPRYYSDNDPLAEEARPIREETVDFGTTQDTSSLYRESSSPLSQYKEQHVYAPPGKIGVAIDVLGGNPIVHKVKKGSPLEGLLQTNDFVVAIDDVDTTCMSAADVTHLMVKRMNYQRKITFVRKDARGIQC